MAGRRAGRRPGKPDTRAAILRAAERAFADRGYDGATIRGIAAEAGVDPALIAHYFGSKEQLFTECVKSPIDPRTVIDSISGGPSETVAERLLEAFLTAWDSPAGVAGVALVRTSMQHEWSARLLREYLLTRALRPLAERVSPRPEEVAWRAGLTASQMAGLVITRHVLKLEPLASASHEAIIATVGPTIQRYLTAPLPLPLAPNP